MLDNFSKQHGFETAPCEAVCRGFCVVLEGVHEGRGNNEKFGAIFYAGPIGGITNVTGKQVLLNPEDFKFLEEYMKKKQAMN